jgi:putative endonuclease
MQFFYAYILESESNPGHFYLGLMEDLRARLRKHNAGEVTHTSKLRPWRIKTAIAFIDKQRAVDFERYLKSASGRAFAKKRL